MPRINTGGGGCSSSSGSSSIELVAGVVAAAAIHLNSISVCLTTTSKSLNIFAYTCRGAVLAASHVSEFSSVYLILSVMERVQTSVLLNCSRAPSQTNYFSER